MRVLQVHTRYRQSGGEDSVVEEEYRLLTQAGHHVERIEFSNPAGVGASLKSLARSPWNTASARRIAEAARRFQPDVVHFHNTWFEASPAVISAVSDLGLPTVATIHNYRFTCANAILYRDERICMDCVGSTPIHGVVHACYRGSRLQSAAVAVTISTQRRRTWPHAVDVVVALTRFAADLMASSGIPSHKVVVKPNTVDDPGPRTSPPSESGDLLFVGRFSEEKGVLDLVAAWERTPHQGRRLVLVGAGPLEEEVAQRGASNIRLTGWLSTAEVGSLMSEARALVVPSRWFEGLPMVVVEALARGTPVVVPAHGALPEIVGDGGWVYPSHDLNALSRILSELSDRDVDARGAAARARYQSTYTSHMGVSHLEEIYELARRARVDRPNSVP